jgi:hypothetical protein
MSEGPPPPPPSSPELLPILTAGVQLAAVVGAWGVASLLLEREVIDDPAFGPLVGPGMAVVSAVVTWLLARRTQRARTPWLGALLALVLSFIGMLIAGAIGAALGHGDVAWLVLGVAPLALAPFVPIAAALSGLTVVAAWGLARASWSDPR